jgi:hypothetical protein
MSSVALSDHLTSAHVNGKAPHLVHFVCFREFNIRSCNCLPACESHYFKIKSRDSSVGIVTGYGLDDRGSGGSFPEGGWKFFSSPPRPERLWGPLSLLSSGYWGGLSSGVKRPGGKADHSPPSSPEVKNEWSCTPNPQYVFMEWYLVKHRNKFTFYLPQLW